MKYKINEHISSFRSLVTIFGDDNPTYFSTCSHKVHQGPRHRRWPFRRAVPWIRTRPGPACSPGKIRMFLFPLLLLKVKRLYACMYVCTFVGQFRTAGYCSETVRAAVVKFSHKITKLESLVLLHFHGRA